MALDKETFSTKAKFLSPPNIDTASTYTCITNLFILLTSIRVTEAGPSYLWPGRVPPPLEIQTWLRTNTLFC